MFRRGAYIASEGWIWQCRRNPSLTRVLIHVQPGLLALEPLNLEQRANIPVVDLPFVDRLRQGGCDGAVHLRCSTGSGYGMVYRRKVGAWVMGGVGVCN